MSRGAYLVIYGILIATQSFALPPSSRPLPFEIALWPPYQLYWLVSLSVGVFVCGKIIILAERSRQKHLWDVFWVMGSFFLVVLFAGLTEQSRAGPFDDNLSRIADMASLTLLPISIPRLAESRPELTMTIRVGFFFKWSGIFMLVHYLISGFWFYTWEYNGGKAEYFDGHRVLPALLVYTLVSLATLYVGIAFWLAKDRLPAPQRQTISRLSRVAIAFIIPMVAIDELRFLIPSLWVLYPREDCFVLPLFYMCTSICVLAYVKVFAESHPHRDLIIPNLWLDLGLSSREGEVATCLAEGRTYKEICSSLHISIGTLQTHIVHIYRKLHINSKTELILLSTKKVNSSENF
uniref:LuxR family transcriptional regulator n=1 Tax=Gracilinema caldarium TaxID=215591 RepID=A0A7C3IJ95_9SPIR